MIFPFTIKYTKPINKNFGLNDTGKIMKAIKDYLENTNAQDIIIIENKLTFRTSIFFGYKSDTFASIERGKFILLENNGKYYLSYEFFMYHLFIFAFIASIAFTLISDLYFGAFCFAGLGGLNWITALVKHRKILNQIISFIENKLEII